MLKKISDIYKIVERQAQKKRLVLAVAQDLHSLEAVIQAKKINIINPILVGDKQKIDKIAKDAGIDLSGVEIVDVLNDNQAVKEAVLMVKEDRADILMKGNVATAVLLKAVLDLESGLKRGALLSHIAIFELENYHKLISMTDVAMNIAPNLLEKTGIINNSVSFLNALGVMNPKVAILAAIELVNPKMQATIDAAILSKMADRNQIANCLIDGPLAFDNAISKESADHKGIDSQVAGDADLLVVPNIETGNVLYKSFAFTGAKLAAVILGAKVPIVLTSRSDSQESKLNSIVLSAAC